MNKVIFMGRLAADPETKTLAASNKNQNQDFKYKPIDNEPEDDLQRRQAIC